MRVISLATVYLATCSLLQACSAQSTASGSASGSGDANATTSEQDSIPLNFIFLSSNNERIKTSGSIPAVDIALRLINENRFLGNYVLGYSEALDSQCDRTQALDKFHEVVHAREEEFVQNIAVIGAGCSVASIPIAEISHYYNIPMISWSSAAAELSNRHKYRNYFRPVPSEEIYSPGLAALLQTYGWRQLAVLTENEELFLHTQKVVLGLLPDVDIVIRQFASNEDPLKIDDFFVASQDMRIFVLNMYVDHAKRILCEAYKREMYYPRYLWITPGWYGDMWWAKDPACSLEAMETVLSYSLSAVQYPLFSETEISQLGLSTMQFRRLYGYQLIQEKLLRNISYAIDLTAPLAFDAVWTLAIALKTTMGKIAASYEGSCADKTGDLVSLEFFDYGNEKLGCLLKESLEETFFLGISGNVTFDESGDRVGNTVRISQYQRGAGRGGAMGTPFIGYAYVDGEGENITGLRVEFVSDLNLTIFWPEGVPPDGIPKEVIVSTALALTVIYDILAFIGIIFALVCCGFNILYRNRKIVRLTSPNLNYLIILGAILLYVSVFFWVYPAKEKEMATILCNFRVWLFSVGNTLCLAVVLSKMWRIHYIFTAPSPKRKPKPPQDWHLLIIISVLVGIDLLILLVPTAINSARVQGELAESVEHGTSRDNLGVVEQHSYYRCYSNSQVIWLFMSYIYKFLLQIAAIYFAFMSRKIRVKALNDSKQIAAIIYITSLLLVISAFGFWIGLLYLNTSTAVFAAAQLVTATVFLGLLFIPKMMGLWVDPTGQNIFGARNYTTTASTNPGTMDEASQAKLLEMTEKVKELEAELEKYQNGSSGNTPQYTFNTTTPTQTSPDTKF